MPLPPVTHPRSVSRLIAVEGCVGSGKTTIATGLADIRGSILLLEDFESVPFFDEFYQNPGAFTLEAEFAFLLHHFHKMKRASYDEGETISDFSLPKDLLFGGLNLAKGPEQKVFRELYDLLVDRVPKVHLTVFISISDELMLSRIRKRNRPQEAIAPDSYFLGINARYRDLIALHQGPSITIQADSMDFWIRPELFIGLSAQVDRVVSE